jgi:hypothetical protein
MRHKFNDDSFVPGAHLHLWRSVIAQAIRDACPLIRPWEDDEVRRDREAARAWLLGDSRDFRLVTALAELDADAVRESALRLKARGWKKPARVKAIPEADEEEALC